MTKKKRLFFIQGITNRPSSSVWLFREYIRQGGFKEFNSFLWITKDDASAQKIADDINLFLSKTPYFFPSRFTLPYINMLPNVEVAAQRLKTLFELTVKGSSPNHIVASIRAAMERTIPRKTLDMALEYVEAGEESSLEGLEKWLLEAGYEKTNRVESIGEYSRRGDILDVFTPQYPLPVRIIFFGDFVEEIRLFDPSSQRSVETLNEFTFIPVSEVILRKSQVERGCDELIRRAESLGWSSEDVVNTMEQLRQGIFGENLLSLMPVIYDTGDTIFDFINGNTLVIIDEACGFFEALKDFWLRASAAYEDAKTRALPPMGRLEEYIVPPNEFINEIKGHELAILHRPSPMDVTVLEQEFDISTTTVTIPEEDQAIVPPTSLSIAPRAGRGKESVRPLIGAMARAVEDGERIIIASATQKGKARITSLFSEYGGDLKIQLLEIRGDSVPQTPGIYLLQGRLSDGFTVKTQGITFINDFELFGLSSENKATLPKRRKATQKAISHIEDLAEGDLVVHRDFGLGIFKGLVQVAAGLAMGEYLLLEYRDGDKLYLPVDRIGLLQRYQGIEGKVPKLDKLGGTSWQLTKKKVKKAIQEIATELVDLYALRQIKRGHAFTPPGPLYLEFEAECPFEETPDQERAIHEILEDMQSPRPMDRLLCGDVGFGKTEVAMRAAFKAVEDGKQVCVLVPTTLLAEQHERTFRERFRRFPVQIEGISRLKGKKEQKAILEGVKSGRVDIVIGTHRLLQADCSFKDLGLLIIDEEHRFGVRHKECIKQLKRDVDCLSLTATPIPRTLQLSLIGIRDLSVIETSPKDRLPVKTFLAEFDPPIIKEAIKNELARGGQVFYVYNRVKGIERMAEKLKTLVPEAVIDVAHGQMDESKLEQVMIRFIRGEVDCLVCTTIIESGIDIPSANTMIIHRADTFGLAQLYQLRGRVGRGHEQAFAYLLVPDIAKIPKDARKRLTAVIEMESKGGGLTLAMEDLKIRGAGNLLGTAQSGQIAKVGYDLFLELLKEAVDELKGVPVEEAIHPEVNVKTPAYIPESYCGNVSERLRLYRQIGMCRTEDEIIEKKTMMQDVFGPIPKEAEILFDITVLKIYLRRLRCIRLDEGAGQGNNRRQFTLTFDPKGPPHPDKILKFVQGGHGKLTPDGRLILITQDLQSLKEILHRLI